MEYGVSLCTTVQFMAFLLVVMARLELKLNSRDKASAFLQRVLCWSMP